MAEAKKGLGKYIYINANDRAFSDLSADNVARCAYLATYVCFGTDELWRTKYGKLFRKDLPSIMNLSKPTADRFWRDVRDKYFFKDDSGFLHTVGRSFIKGKLNVPFFDEYQKLYIAVLKELYEKIPVTQHKRLGYVLKMLPYLNFEYNILCHDPTVKTRDKISPLTMEEFCELIGHDKTHASDLAKDYGRLTFTVNGNNEVFCKFLSDGSNINTAHIYINPRLVYKGTNPRKVTAIGLSFAASLKPT